LQRLDMPYKLIKSKGMTPRRKLAFWKLQIWTLTQYDKLIWLESDTILYRGVDWLFDRPWMWGQRDDWFCRLNQKAVNTGILSLEPKMEDFTGLLNYAETLQELDDGDEQLIPMYFEHVRHRPINLLSDVEAAFGHCLGRAPSPYINQDGSTIWGAWSTPALVHKSGGWGNAKDDSYSNACFSHNMSLQLYTVGSTTINACQYHPLGEYWRRLFCTAAWDMTGIRTVAVAAFCSDACWYRGVERGAEGLRESDLVGDLDEVVCPHNTTLSLGDYNGRVVGHPILEKPAPPLLPNTWQFGSVMK